MFGSQVIDVAIGMVFVYLLLSLVCSAANELIETVMKNRAAKLEEGIRSLLNDDGLANQLYNHTLVSGLYTKTKGETVLHSFAHICSRTPEHRSSGCHFDGRRIKPRASGARHGCQPASQSRSRLD